jgi:signal transduction histidine kinase
LRKRLGLWMVLSTTSTLFVFACAVYLLIRAEAEEPGAPSGEDAREQVLVAMLLAGPVCLGLSVAGAMVLSRRALAPLDAVIRGSSGMSAEDLHQRLDVPKENDELRDLVLALNALLARLDRGFAALGSYAASASHELRTPLAVVISEIEVALRHPRASEEWERIARTLLDELRGLVRLVEALLELGRVTASPNLSREPFELGERLDQALAALAATVERAGVRLISPADGAAVGLHGDAHLLMNAVRELVENAARYVPPGSSVWVSLERADDRHVAIHVDDDGPGVPDAEREAIFAPFTRGSRGRAIDAAGDGVRGVGLGLAVAKRSVEAWGGTVSVSDSPRGGARFTIVVPLPVPAR